MTDFIYTITVDIVGEGEGEYVTENNYKEIIRDLKGTITSFEYDNELLDEEVDKLVDNNEMPYSEWNKKIDKLGEQRRENNEYIKKCENTIEIIEKIAEIREWE
jgi:vesicle coat complex subunit